MKTIKYSTSLFTFYIKGIITTEQNFLKITIPNTILGLIPFGSGKFNIPVEQISSVTSNFKFDIKSFFYGLFSLLMAYIFISSGLNGIIYGIMLLLLGIGLVLNSFITEIQIFTTSGTYYHIPFIIFEKSKATEAEQMVANIINDRLNDTNTKQVSEASTNAIVNAIRENKQP